MQYLPLPKHFSNKQAQEIMRKVQKLLHSLDMLYQEDLPIFYSWEISEEGEDIRVEVAGNLIGGEEKPWIGFVHFDTDNNIHKMSWSTL